VRHTSRRGQGGQPPQSYSGSRKELQAACCLLAQPLPRGPPMSAVYNTEPPTNGKVVLKTTLGDVDLELWPKEAPKVCMAVCPPPPRPHSLRHRSASLTHLASPPLGWAAQAVRNFIQLCTEGYFNGCTFFRLVKDLFAQTGDPTNTGDGACCRAAGRPQIDLSVFLLSTRLPQAPMRVVAVWWLL
jgi:hypothetical protein